MTTIEALITKLVLAGLPLDPAVVSGRSNPKPKSGRYLTLIAVPGERPVGTHNAGQRAYLKPHIQVTAVAPTNAEAEALALQAIDVLTFSNEEVTDGGSPADRAWFLYCTPIQSEPYDVGPNAKGQPRWQFNVGVHRKGE